LNYTRVLTVSNVTIKSFRCQ